MKKTIKFTKIDFCDLCSIENSFETLIDKKSQLFIYFSDTFSLSRFSTRIGRSFHVQQSLLELGASRAPLENQKLGRLSRAEL